MARSKCQNDSVSAGRIRLVRVDDKVRKKRHNGRSFSTDTKCTFTIVRGRDPLLIKRFIDSVQTVMDCVVMPLSDITRGKEYRYVLDRMPIFVHTDGHEFDTLENVESLAQEIHSAYNSKGELNVTLMVHDVQGLGDRRHFEFSTDAFFRKFDQISHSLVIHKFVFSGKCVERKQKEWYE